MNNTPAIQSALDLIFERAENSKNISGWRDVFKVDTIDNIGENWLMADFGQDEQGHYIITTDHIRASKSGEFLNGAKEDAELVCRLLNAYYKHKAEICALNRWNNEK